MTSPTLYAVIMAGGSGTRFWPASRKRQPKQMLPLAPGDTRSLLRISVERIASLVPPERVFIVTSSVLAEATAAELPDVPRSNILAEPAARNTAACVGWAAAHIKRRDDQATVMVLPADHHIGDEEAYLDVLGRAVAAAAEGALVTVGITPTRPETGYGYLEMGDSVAPQVYQAKRFVEKPSLERAAEFLAAGTFVWNSGMFFFRADAILDAIVTHLPSLGAQLAAYDDAASRGREAALVEETYAKLPSISIDHGVMEKAERVRVVPGSFGWSDLGSWVTAWELSQQDGAGNAAPSDAILIDATGNYVSAEPGKLVALVGVHDLVVVETKDAILILPRDRAQDVKQVVERLSARADTRV